VKVEIDRKCCFEMGLKLGNCWDSKDDDHMFDISFFGWRGYVIVYIHHHDFNSIYNPEPGTQQNRVSNLHPPTPSKPTGSPPKEKLGTLTSILPKMRHLC
jgi:hypothetical protein